MKIIKKDRKTDPFVILYIYSQVLNLKHAARQRKKNNFKAYDCLNFHNIHFIHSIQYSVSIFSLVKLSGDIHFYFATANFRVAVDRLNIVLLFASPQFTFDSDFRKSLFTIFSLKMLRSLSS